jgi:hypothetical protein
MSDVAEAQRYVGFPILAPKIGTPKLIQIDDPRQTAPEDETVAFIYEFPDMGIVNIEERQPGDITLQKLENRANDPTNPPGAFVMVPIRGTRGLLVSGDGIGRLIWIEGGILIDLSGESITPNQVQILASEL